MDLDWLVARYGLTVGGQNARVVRVLCVFHYENTPSLVLWRESQRFLCHGCCRGGGVDELAEFLAADFARPVRPVYAGYQLELFPDPDQPF